MARFGTLLSIAIVDEDLDAAEREQVEPGSADDHVGLERLSRFERDPVPRERANASGLDRCVAAPDRLEQIGVGHEADALIPRRVQGPEVLVDRKAPRQLLLHACADQAAREVGKAAADLEEQHREQDVLRADQLVREAAWQDLASQIREHVARGQRGDVRGRALQHDHVLRRFCKRGNQRHGGGAAADHDDLFSTDVQPLGPLLRVDPSALKIGAPGEIGLVSSLVVVITAADIEEGRGVFALLFFRARLRGHKPALFARGPARRDHPGVEADVRLDTQLSRGIPDISKYRGPVGDRLRFGPRAERIPEREHVRIRSQAGIAKEIPGAADLTAALEDRVRLAWTLLLQMSSGPDSGETGADDQDVHEVRQALAPQVRRFAVNIHAPCCHGAAA